MDARLGVIRGASKQDVFGKKFNIYLGISLGNKWFTKEHIREHLKFALKYSKDRVGLLVADTLHTTNYIVRNRVKPEKAIRASLKKGDEIISILKELIDELPKKERSRIDIIRWDDVKKDALYKKLLPVAEKEFRENREFKEEVLAIIKEHLMEEERIFSDKEIEGFGEYIIEELPEIVNGFTFNDVSYNCFLYPQDAKLAILVEELQNGKIFPEFGKKIVERHCVFVELIVD